MKFIHRIHCFGRPLLQFGNTPLHLAISGGDLDDVNKVLGIIRKMDSGTQQKCFMAIDEVGLKPEFLRSRENAGV